MHCIVATSDWSLFSSARRSAEPTLPMPINKSTEDHIDALPLAPAPSLTSKLSVRSLTPKPTIPPPAPKPTIPSLAPVFSTPSNQSYTTSIQPVHLSDQLGEIFDNVGGFENTNPCDAPQPDLSCSLVTGTTSTPPEPDSTQPNPSNTLVTATTFALPEADPTPLNPFQMLVAATTASTQPEINLGLPLPTSDPVRPSHLVDEPRQVTPGHAHSQAGARPLNSSPGQEGTLPTNLCPPPDLLVGRTDKPTWMKKKRTLDYFRGTFKLGDLSSVISHWYKLEELLGFQEAVSFPE